MPGGKREPKKTSAKKTKSVPTIAPAISPAKLNMDGRPTNSAPSISPGNVQSMDAGRPTNSASHSLPRTQEAAARSNVKAYILEDVVSFPVRSKFSPDGKSLKYTVWAMVDNKVCQIATFKEKKAQQLNRDDQIKFIKLHYDATYGYMIRPDTVIMKTSSPLNQTEVGLKRQFFNPPVYTIDQAASISNGVRISLEKVGITSIGEIQIANGSKRRELNLKYSGRSAKLTAWNEVADTVGGCHLQAGKMYHIKSVVPTNDFQDCRCYNASPSTTFELLEDRVEETGIIDGVVESVSFESNIIEVQDEYYNIPKTMLMAVFPSGIFVNNTNIRAKRRREEVIEIMDVKQQKTD